MKLFSVQDKKASYFQNPLTMRNAQEAIRAFETTIKKGDNPFSDFPEDFSLVELGSFNPDNGKIDLNDSPVVLINASELIKQ